MRVSTTSRPFASSICSAARSRYAIAIATAGNLSATQNVVNLLAEGVDTSESPAREHSSVNRIDEAPTMYAVAQLVGRAVRQVRRVDTDAYEQESVAFQVSFLVGGQIGKERPRLFMVYSAGNFIECAPDAPFLQIGEHKYGKPILDRAITFKSDLYDALKIGLISMDSTLKSNLGVGLPIDIAVIRRDSHKFEVDERIEAYDPYFRDLRERWSAALRAAHAGIPRPPYGPDKELTKPSLPTLPGGTGASSGKKRLMTPPRWPGGGGRRLEGRIRIESVVARPQRRPARACASWAPAAAWSASARRGRRRRLIGVGRAGVGQRGLFGRRGNDLRAAFAVGQPDVIDRMLDAMKAGARREHPAGEQPIEGVLFRDLVDLDEDVGARRLGRRPREADARRDLQRAELHGLVDGDFERNDAPGDLVEALEHRGRMLDPIGAGGRAGADKRADEQ